MKSRIAPAFALSLVLAVCVFFIAASRAATETPEYKVVLTDGQVEIRDYPAIEVATTGMKDDAMNPAFRRLFNFIAGGNEARKKIEMTAPVLISPGDEARNMHFIMPAKTAEKGAPAPSSPDVTVEKMPATRYVAMRFPGGRSEKNETAAAAKLADWMKARALDPLKGPFFAYYDPPWTPTFLRRNEVLFEIAPGAGEERR